MKLNLKGVSKGTWSRIVAMVIVLVNLVMTTFFDTQLVPYSDEQVYEGASVLVTVVMATLAGWKNNSLTEDAQWADKHLDRLKK